MPRRAAISIGTDGTPELPFEARLAQENGRSRAYTQRVIVEYKRFLYLTMTAGHVVTPSEEPVAFLVLTIAVGAVLSILVVVARLNRLTRHGKHVLQRLPAANRELCSQSASELAESAGLAVALFGPTILTGSLLGPLASWYPRPPGAGQRRGGWRRVRGRRLWRWRRVRRRRQVWGRWLWRLWRLTW